PWTSQPPILANTVDGELMPSHDLTASTIPKKMLFSDSHRKLQPALMPFHRPLTRLTPMSSRCGPSVFKMLKMALGSSLKNRFRFSQASTSTALITSHAPENTVF